MAATHARSKESLFDETAALFKALSHPLRLRLVCGLLKEPTTLTRISKALDIPPSSLAQHLSVLRNEGIVEGKRENGAEVILSVVDQRAVRIFKLLCPGFESREAEWDCSIR